METELPLPGRRADRPPAAVRGRPGRGQGVRQDRGDRQPDAARGPPDHRRRHGLHVPQGDGQARRQVAGRRRQAGGRASDPDAGGRSATCRCCFRPTTSSRQSPRRARRPRPSAWTTPRSATAWAWTSGRPRRTPMPTRFGTPRPSSGTARWACSRSTPSPRARWPWRRRWQACKGISIIGGGDSIAAMNKAGLAERISHISTGGGASLELLGGLTLPGVAVLPDAT